MLTTRGAAAALGFLIPLGATCSKGAAPTTDKALARRSQAAARRQDTQCASFNPAAECCLPGNFVRNALRRGIEGEEQIGANPLKLGIISDTDTHNGTPGDTDEFAYQGQHGRFDGSPELRLITTSDEAYNNGGGLVAVWAKENSRDEIFNALRRRETYGTSGTRPKMRFFGGWTYPDNPTCRVYQYDCNKISLDQRPASCSDGSYQRVIQNRAWSSPIWYLP